MFPVTRHPHCLSPTTQCRGGVPPPAGRLPVAVPGVRLADSAASLHTDRGHSLRSLFPPQAALPSLPVPYGKSPVSLRTGVHTGVAIYGGFYEYARDNRIIPISQGLFVGNKFLAGHGFIGNNRRLRIHIAF